MLKDEIAKFLVINPDHLEPVQPVALKSGDFQVIQGSMTVKECYNNALNAVIGLEGNAVILGVAVINSLGFPVEHAWIEMPDGSHTDPTFQNQHGEDYVNEYTYYSLHRIPREEYLPLARKLSRGKHLMAIDLTSLRRWPATVHLFENDYISNLYEVIRAGKERQKGRAQEDS